MSRFYERYGHVIVWILTAFLGVALSAWLASYCVAVGIVGPPYREWVVTTQNYLSERIVFAELFLKTHGQLLGATATLGTFLFGLVQGIRHARRYLPTRLLRFMDEQLAPVHDNTALLLAMVNLHSANAPQGSPLFLKKPLDQALDALAPPWRPKRKASLDETIKEAERHIEVTAKRLEHLQDLRDHARLLKGAVTSTESWGQSGRSDKTADAQGDPEADFAGASANPKTKAAALELRGLLRSRINNLTGALQDFEELERVANASGSIRSSARARRLQAEIKIRQSLGVSKARLDRAQTLLGRGKGLFEDGRTLVDADYLELGLNRFAYTGDLRRRGI